MPYQHIIKFNITLHDMPWKILLYCVTLTLNVERRDNKIHLTSRISSTLRKMSPRANPLYLKTEKYVKLYIFVIHKFVYIKQKCLKNLMSTFQ